ncbi:MAG: hypothetical protein FWD35_06800 [Oscillospiraceae bacterium]|nr:hypothetical protein [Oscillospiraceae bacterium]
MIVRTTTKEYSYYDVHSGGFRRFCYGLFVVSQDDNWGVINKRGEVVLPLEHKILVNPVSGYIFIDFAGFEDTIPQFTLFHNREWITVSGNAPPPRPGAVIDGNTVTVADALEILRFVVGLTNAISDNGSESRQWKAALVTGGEEPQIDDALQILRYVVKLSSVFD